MLPLLEVAGTGVSAFRLHPLRNLVTTAALVAVLTPYLAGLGLSRGVWDQAEQAVDAGADLYVTARQFGRPVPVPLAWVPEFSRIDGVTAVVPRIVGTVFLGKDQVEAVLVGVPLERFPPALACVDGRLYEAGSQNELVVGTELARRLNLHVGALVPPFYHNRHGDRLSKVVGLFRSDVSLWQANLVVTTFNSAAGVFDQEGLATDLLVSCRPGYQEAVRANVLQRATLGPADAAGNRPRPHVTTRDDLRALLPRGALFREGIFNLHFVLAFVVGILVVLVTSGLGLAEGRREVGILKATGWQTDEVLLRSLVEGVLVSTLAAAVAVLLAYGWLRGLNGFWIASLFLTGAEVRPAFPVPFDLGPVPVGLAFLVSLAVVLTGSLYATWRAATVPPREALR